MQQLSKQVNQIKQRSPLPTGSTQIEKQERKRNYQPKIVCPECVDGYGVVSRMGDDGYFYADHCQTCREKRVSEQRDKMQHISIMTQDERLLRFDDVETHGRPDTAKMMQAVREFIDSPTGMQTFHGSNGNGKSAALIVAVNECLDRGISAIYIPTADMLNWIQDAFNKDGATKDGSMLDRLNKLKSVDVLALDELQAIKESDWRIEQLENIIDYRHRFGLDGELGTLFAMNEHPDKLQSYRIRSRMKHGGNATDPIIKNNDPDIREGLK